MADLTIGEVGKGLRLFLRYVDQTQNPPVQLPLSLAGFDKVQLSYLITDPQAKPNTQPPFVRTMAIIDLSNGIVQYTFQVGDLIKPPNMGKYGELRYTVQVLFLDGSVLSSNENGRLTVKDDSVL